VRQLAQIHRAASESNLGFLLIGGWAVCAHGYSRLTEDLDLLAQTEKRSEWAALLEKLGYVSRHQPGPFGQWTPPDAEAGFTVLDVMFVSESTFVQMSSEAKAVYVEGTETKIPSLEHLFALKIHAIRFGGERRKMKDYIDLTYLMDINKVDAKSDWIRNVCLKYGTPEIYENLRGKT
jgi:hypothetical protein